MIDLKEMFDIVEIPVNLFYALILGEKKHKKVTMQISKFDKSIKLNSDTFLERISK